MKLIYPVLLAATCTGLHATVTISSVTASLPSPQPLGTPVTFTVTATDSNPGPLTFQFNTAFKKQSFDIIRNFNVGTLSSGIWSAQPFSWSEISSEGSYTIQVVAKDFTSGETATQAIPFTLNSIVENKQITVLPTSNPIVELAAVPTCSAGNYARVIFQDVSINVPTVTSWEPCLGVGSTNFYLGGLYAKSSYKAGYQIKTGSTVTNGSSTATFTTGPLPASFPFPTETVLKKTKSSLDTAEDYLLHSFTVTSATAENYQPVATDLAGNTVWYYDGGPNDYALLTRPTPGGKFLLIEGGLLWSNGSDQQGQLLRLVDLTGNVLRETNSGLVSQQLVALGATDMQQCGSVPLPAPVGAACLTGFTHELIALPNGDLAAMGLVEKIFPPGTQGNTTGLNVDVIGNSIIILDTNLNPVWYWDVFQHDGGGNQFDINRPAVLGETCSPTQGGCAPLFLTGTPGVTTLGNDWIHGNSLQYRSSDGNIIFSSRHQDWVVKINYNNGAGNGDLLWRMGVDGDFTFNNINNDPYPWFSHQHDAGFETNGVFDCFDNGNTRVANSGSGNSRGYALNVDESTLTVTPVLSQDLGFYGFALGSAQLLSNGDYHFQPGVVTPTNDSYSIELLPTPGTTGSTTVYNLQSAFSSYRSFRMPSLYVPPTT